MPRLKAKAVRDPSPSASVRRQAVPRRAATQSSRRRDRRVGFALAVLFGAFVVGGLTWTASVQIQNAANAEALVIAEADKERRRAAVLFVPMKGNVCRRRVIDNETWLIADAGYVTCDEAVTWNSHYPDVKFQFTERVEQLRSGFRTNGQSGGTQK